MKSYTPQKIVKELDNFIIGQTDAKKSVAIALRNRWRRRQLEESLQKEVIPKNILMIGPTGVGKTEISRRLAKLDNAPFIKVEATKFTEIGYVGRDVEQIIRDLMEVAIKLKKEELKSSIKSQAEENAINRIINIIAGSGASEETKVKFREKFQKGELSDTQIEIEIKDKQQQSMLEVPGMPGAQIGMLNIDSILGREKTKKKNVTTGKAFTVFVEEESESLIDNDTLISEAIDTVENNGIVFIDEIDKIASSYSDRKGGDVSREGVQRDLLPLVEGTTVNTKYGSIKTDHILFVASGAFHLSKPSDLLPELQGRLPIRVELSPLTKEEFKRILIEPKANLILQYTEMLKTEGVELIFEDDAIDEIASITEHFNKTIEDIGARRLHTVLEKILEEINFSASEKSGEKYIITKELVTEKVSFLKQNLDLSKFII